MNTKSFSKKLWGGRFYKPTDKLVEDYTESISVDYQLYKQDIRGTAAHVEMLNKAGYLTQKEKSKILTALKELEKEIKLQLKLKKFSPESSYEDIHTYIEKKLTEKIGDAGTKIHAGRSRNDQIALDLRLYIRDEISELISLLNNLCLTILNLAKKYKGTIIPGYTHLQIAQPILFSEYIRAFFEMFLRDIGRIVDCFKRLNYSPLGAGAVGGTYLKVDRNHIAEKLNFCGVLKNTVDAVSDRDFVVEYLFTLSTIMMHISRLSEDFIIWFSPQFKFIDINDTFLTGSSILPQKKNPDVCELARSRTGRIYGNLVNLLTIMKGLPLSYNRDMQEDKKALFDSSNTVKETIKVYTKLLKSVRLNKEKLLEALKSKDTYSTAPHLVDYLVESGLSLRSAHKFVGEFIRYCERKKLDFYNLKISDIKNFLKNKSLDANISIDKILKVISEIDTCRSDSNLNNEIKNDLKRLKKLCSLMYKIQKICNH